MAAGSVFFRLDREDPREWAWKGFPARRNRFDPFSGEFRVRYGGLTLLGAFRERYLSTGRYVPADHEHHRIVRMEAVRRLRVLDLRTEANLDALGVDDRISTGREPAVWEAAHRLADATRTWWPELDGLLYRSRTTPASSVNIAFFASDPFRLESQPLASATDVLANLALDHGFTLGWQL